MGKTDIKALKAENKAQNKARRQAKRAKLWATAKHYVICIVLLASVVGLVQLGMYIQRQNDADVKNQVVVKQQEIVELIEAVQSKSK